MQENDFYSNAHLVVAAIRIIEHQKSSEPTVDAICRFLSFSPEQGNFICRQLREMGILDSIESAYGVRLFIKNHLKLEEIPRGEQDTRLEKELAKFQNHREEIDQKVKTFQSEQAQKQKDLFAALGKKLKNDLEKE
jgi:FtsZ-binding cell division protein ZapB